nr:hypothetical protein [Pseudomonas sp. HS-2]
MCIRDRPDWSWVHALSLIHLEMCIRDRPDWSWVHALSLIHI